MPEFPIVDAHVHLYDPAAIAFPWMEKVPKLNRPYLPADFDRLTAGVDVEAMVFVEVDAAPGRHLDEARWVAGLARREPRLRGMVASIPLEKGAAAAADLDAYAALPIARGVRRLIERHAEEPGWCLQPAFVEGVRLLPRYGFAFDLCLFHPQLAEVTELCRRCPEVRFVIDHIAKPASAPVSASHGAARCARSRACPTSRARSRASSPRPITPPGARPRSLPTSPMPSSASASSG
jgi:L-fuconolactonase